MHNEKSEKMFTFLRGVCSDGLHPNTSKALGFARERHQGQTRKDNETPYIIHPLSLACDAVGLGLNDDIMLAMLILHDVPEDADIQIMDLPVDSRVRHAVECMTLRYKAKEPKWVTKRHYFANISTDRYAIIGKALDRRDNFGTMVSLPERNQIKNVYETHYLLLPLLKEAKLSWPEYSNQLHTIRKDLSSLTNIYAAFNHLELPKEMPPDDFFKDIFV